MNALQERQWIEAARQGSRDAFEQLVRLYEKRVFALALRMCGDPDDAAEAAQEAFLSAWQGLRSFRGDASFSTWLYRLTANACVDILRRERRRASVLSLDHAEPKLSIPDTAPSPQEEMERIELREQIEAGLASLSPGYRQTLVLRELRQFSYEEIAKTLCLDMGTVKSRISRGRKQLRKFLLESGNFPGGLSSKKTEKEGCR